MYDGNFVAIAEIPTVVYLERSQKAGIYVKIVSLKA